MTTDFGFSSPGKHLPLSQSKKKKISKYWYNGASKCVFVFLPSIATLCIGPLKIFGFNHHAYTFRCLHIKIPNCYYALLYLQHLKTIKIFNFPNISEVHRCFFLFLLKLKSELIIFQKNSLLKSNIQYLKSNMTKREFLSQIWYLFWYQWSDFFFFFLN